MLRVHRLKRLSLVLTIYVTVIGNASIAGEVGRTTGGTVAVIISADVEAYTAALKGFKRTFRHRVVAEYNMEGDFGRGREILTDIQSKIKPDLVLAIGIWAFQLVIDRTIAIPVIYAMVLNPQSIVKDGAKNITGASMNIPVELTVQLFKDLNPKIRRVGAVYNQMHTGYLVKQANAVARQHGLQLLAKEVRSSKEAISALDSLQDESLDMLWILPDETVLAPAVIEHMLLLSYRRKIPLLGLSERHAEMGALLSLSFASSEDIGRQAGELANIVAGGRPVTEVPHTTARQVRVTVNLKAAQRLGMEIPKDFLEKANRVIQ
jgi:putative ABC transport system substrate-binding protein